MVAVGFTQGAVKVFDAATGHRLHMLVLGAGVDSVAFSPDGTLLATGLESGRIRLFDTRSWCETKQIGKPAELIEGVAFSPDGSLLATATFEKVLLWSVADGKQVRTFEVLPGQPPKIFADEMEREARLWRMAWRVAFSPDGKLLATGSSGAVQLWDVATGRAIKSTPSGGVGSLYFSPDGQWVVWGNGQNEIVRWNPRTGKRLRIKDEFSLGDTAITPDGNLILSPGARTDIAIYDFLSRRKVGVLTCTKQRH
jgi:WD40 repeat protein